VLNLIRSLVFACLAFFRTRRRLAIEDVTSLLKERLAELATLHWAGEAELNAVVDDLLAGRADPYTLADEMIAKNLEQMLKKRAS